MMGCAVDAMLEGTSGAHQWNQVAFVFTIFMSKIELAHHHHFSVIYLCRPVPFTYISVCKMKAHKKCMNKIVERCKWTVECTIPSHLRYINPEDWRCLWCACCIHSSCLPQLGRGCSLGATSLSVLPPLAIRGVSEEGLADIRADAIGGEYGGGSPLLVLVNSKSGDNQGQRMIRKFKRLLNPLQVFDIIVTGPDFALSFFDSFDCFRVLVCGGDGTVGWVLGAFDRLGLHNRCQLAILPIGTGNDLARVLGWGHAFYDDTQLPQLIRTFERAHTRMLDRWSVLSVEGPQAAVVREYKDTVLKHVRSVMEANDPGDVFKAVKLCTCSLRSLCETVRGLMENIAVTYTKVEQWEKEAGRLSNDPLTEKYDCVLDVLMKSLSIEENGMEESGFEPEDDERSASEERRKRDQLVGRANSLKKALKDIMSIAERGIDQHIRLSCSRVLPAPPDETKVFSTATRSTKPSYDNDHHRLQHHDRLFKPNSESKLNIEEEDITFDIKTSHSDSSIYDCALEGDCCSRVDDLSCSGSRLKQSKNSSNLPNVKSVLPTGLSGGSLIAEILLLNARVLGLRSVHNSQCCQASLDQYKELKVMNNYFGIGLDAKIALEFHNKREESEKVSLLFGAKFSTFAYTFIRLPLKTRSRSRLFMWYGILGGKELMQRTYRNLDQRIRLECDGVPVELPSLQGFFSTFL
uniref:Diacylglycerol kinase n=1 Tax=Angiostrongylus cantonensis TaxID=6313 RepID=A0A0K0DJX9_ANGCA